MNDKLINEKLNNSDNNFWKNVRDRRFCETINKNNTSIMKVRNKQKIVLCWFNIVFVINENRG